METIPFSELEALNESAVGILSILTAVVYSMKPIAYSELHDRVTAECQIDTDVFQKALKVLLEIKYIIEAKQGEVSFYSKNRQYYFKLF